MLLITPPSSFAFPSTDGGFGSASVVRRRYREYFGGLDDMGLESSAKGSAEGILAGMIESTPFQRLYVLICCSVAVAKKLVHHTADEELMSRREERAMNQGS